MTRPRALGLAWLALVLLACSSPASSSGTAGLGESFRLAPGESTLVEGALDVRFDRVTNDSRCATDVVCITGGDATVHVTVKAGPGRGPERQFELHTGPDRQPSQVEVGSNRVLSLLALEPLPRSTEPIAPEAYRATFRVTAH